MDWFKKIFRRNRIRVTLYDEDWTPVAVLKRKDMKHWRVDDHS